MNAIFVPRVIILVQHLQARLHFLDRGRVKQFAKIRVAQNFFQLRLINRKCLRAAFG